MKPSKSKLPSIKTVISTAASITASAMVARSLAKQYMPPELQQYLHNKYTTFVASFTSQLTLIIEEHEELTQNQLFEAAQLYLATLLSPNMHRYRVSLPVKENKIVVTMDKNEEITDTFNGVEFNWKLLSKKIPRTTIADPDSHHGSISKSESRSFELSFHKKHKEFVFDTYLPFLLSKSKKVEEDNKTIKLFTLHDRHSYSKSWISVKLDHPSNFDTLAMDSEMKKAIMDDLDMFVKRKDYYRRVGKAWKRGYLLYGPPGTGKSSLIAAMANYLNFNIYDLELTFLRTNCDLRRLLISTSNKSILVVEDIECSIQFHDRKKQQATSLDHSGIDGAFDHYSDGVDKSQMTLSGFLNFIDGLWSSCGDQRIIVFTTNHKERIDPALLRPGRMDMHIHMSYCTPSGFKQLAFNYLGITDHPLFSELERLIEMVNATPAEVGEHLMKNEDTEIALIGLIEFLQVKKETEEAKDSEVAASEAKAEQDSDVQKSTSFASPQNEP